MKAPSELKRKFVQLWPHLNERARRMVAAEEAVRLGRGGISLVSRACGLSRVTITKAIGELDAEPLPAGRVRLVIGMQMGPTSARKVDPPVSVD